MKPDEKLYGLNHSTFRALAGKRVEVLVAPSDHPLSGLKITGTVIYPQVNVGLIKIVLDGILESFESFYFNYRTEPESFTGIKWIRLHGDQISSAYSPDNSEAITQHRLQRTSLHKERLTKILQEMKDEEESDFRGYVSKKSLERSMANTKLEEAILWLGQNHHVISNPD